MNKPWPLLASMLVLAACGAATREVAANQSDATAAPNAHAVIAFPQLTGRVVDQAELLTPAEEASLSAELATLEQRTSDQFVVVTIPTLGGRDIADYSRDLGNHWRLGHAGRNNGVLLVVAPAEHRVRIAVGDGLVSALSNQRTQEIVNHDLLPQFSAGRWFEGIRSGSRSIIGALTQAGGGAGGPAR
jgi:uncharacterized protein